MDEQPWDLSLDEISKLEFDCYDPHADLLDLAIWSMYQWVVQAIDQLNANLAAAVVASTDSSVTSVPTAQKNLTPVSTDSNVPTPQKNSRRVSNDSSASTPQKNSARVSTDNNAPAMELPALPAAERHALQAKLTDPLIQFLVNTQPYFFSASDIFALMHAEALRRNRADLAERLTPASTGRLLSELGLPRDRTARGRRFRLTFQALTALLNNFIYVFDPEAAQHTYTRRWRE